jgi:hypothetical protein
LGGAEGGDRTALFTFKGTTPLSTLLALGLPRLADDVEPSLRQGRLGGRALCTRFYARVEVCDGETASPKNPTTSAMINRPRRATCPCLRVGQCVRAGLGSQSCERRRLVEGADRRDIVRNNAVQVGGNFRHSKLHRRVSKPV